MGVRGFLRMGCVRYQVPTYGVSRVGFEPTTHGLKVRCSSTELPARYRAQLYCMTARRRSDGRPYRGVS